MSHPITESVLNRIAEGLSGATCEAWVEHRLGKQLWSKQREIAESVRENRYTAVPSCHGAGKSQLAAWIALWWANAHPVGEAFVVTAAPTQAQIEGVVWRYIGQAHAAAQLPGRVIQGSVPALRAANGEMVAWGRKPADFADPAMAMQAFQGIHARYVLVVLDEACGIPAWLWDATDTLVVNDHSRVLAIGNPDSPAARFEKVCRPGSGWNVIPIGAEDTPNFTGERVAPEVADTLISQRWVGERERRWGRESALFTSKVLGRFPDGRASPRSVWRAGSHGRATSGDAALSSIEKHPPLPERNPLQSPSRAKPVPQNAAATRPTQRRRSP